MHGVRVLREQIAKVTNMQHVKIVHLKPNNYAVTSSIIAPESFVMESGNMIYGSVQWEDVCNFHRTVQPVINEKCLEPAQITLF